MLGGAVTALIRSFFFFSFFVNLGKKVVFTPNVGLEFMTQGSTEPAPARRFLVSADVKRPIQWVKGNAESWFSTVNLLETEEPGLLGCGADCRSGEPWMMLGVHSLQG